MTAFQRIDELCGKACQKEIDRHNLEQIAAWPLEELPVLFAGADKVRRHFLAGTVEACAIMSIKTGGCGEDCAFCSQSLHNKAKISVRDLAGKGEIVEAFRSAREQGLALGLVASGKRLSPEEVGLVAEAVRECEGPGVHASFGVLGEEELKILREAGVTCYNHNLETGRDFFGRIVTTHTYDERVATVKRAGDVGMRVCCGGLFGLGETWDDRIALCLELRNLDVDVVPLNFLHWTPGTAVEPARESPLEFLKIVSLFRFGLPDKHIKVCGGREVILGKLQGLIFHAGADGYISGDYLTTKGDSVASDDRMVEALGLTKAVPGF